MSFVVWTTLPLLSLHSIWVGSGDNCEPLKSILTVSPGCAGWVVLLYFTISILVSAVGTNAKFTLYHPPLAGLGTGAVWGVNDEPICHAGLNTGDIKLEYPNTFSPFGFIT